MDLDALSSFLSVALQSQITQFGIAFSAAAWIHSGRVKKEIKTSFAGLSDAISELGVALREDLRSQAKRIENVEDGVQDIRLRVKKLEGA